MFALIGAFVVPLAGIILGHLSLSYMKKGQLSTQNKGMATAGLILGYVFVGLSFLTGLILFIVLIASAASDF
jgi:peptidyl-prolyl cis-trans isomerase B (cyclophilin B)